MAVLSDSDRKEAWEDFIHDCGKSKEPIELVKADLRAAIDAIDDYLHNNMSAINSAIPQPARGVLTAKQKARLLVFVIQKRFLRGDINGIR